MIFRAPDTCRDMRRAVAKSPTPGRVHALIALPSLPPQRGVGHPRADAGLPKKRCRTLKWTTRRVADSVFYLLRSGCSWHMLPREYPPWETVWIVYTHMTKMVVRPLRGGGDYVALRRTAQAIVTHFCPSSAQISFAHNVLKSGPNKS